MGYIENLRQQIGHQPLLLPGAAVIIENSYDQILLQKRVYPVDTWGLPGGLMEIGETPEQTAKREVYEECGLTLYAMKLVNVYASTGEPSIAANGDCYYPITIVYATRSYSGELIIDRKESEAYQFCSVTEHSPALLPNHRRIIDAWINQRRRNN
ncbi:MAG: NUDIX domain-containing protein [Sporolactobacillus sp.]